MSYKAFDSTLRPKDLCGWRPAHTRRILHGGENKAPVCWQSLEKRSELIGFNKIKFEFFYVISS